MRRLLSLLLLPIAVVAMAQPLEDDEAERLPAAQVEARLAESHPVESYRYAQRLFRQGKRDEAVTWFYIGQLRFRYRLLANPNLPPDGEPALMASLNATLGQTFNEWAGGSPRDWVAAIDRALAWDAAHPNPLTPKDQHAAELARIRGGLQGLRDDIMASEQTIREQRKANGLENR